MLTPARIRHAVRRAIVRRDERGMTLTELTTTMAISLILLTMMGTMVTVFSKAEASTVSSADAAAFTRLALLQFQHDVQSAVPVGTVTLGTCPGTSPWKSPCYGSYNGFNVYDDSLDVTVQPSGQVVAWTYSPSTQKLTRQVGTAPAVVELANVKNGDPTGSGIPVFHYFDACGNDLVAQGLAANPAPNPSTIASNATVVQITVAVTNLNAAPYGTTTSVNVMNKSPGISPSC